MVSFLGEKIHWYTCLIISCFKLRLGHVIKKLACRIHCPVIFSFGKRGIDCSGGSRRFCRLCRYQWLERLKIARKSLWKSLVDRKLSWSSEFRRHVAFVPVLLRSFIRVGPSLRGLLRSSSGWHKVGPRNEGSYGQSHPAWPAMKLGCGFGVVFPRKSLVAARRVAGGFHDWSGQLAGDADRRRESAQHLVERDVLQSSSVWQEV